MEITNLSQEELDNIERYDYHNKDFNFPLWASKLKRALEKQTGQKFYVGADCQIHLCEKDERT